jgi:hypothetical protein
MSTAVDKMDIECFTWLLAKYGRKVRLEKMKL